MTIEVRQLLITSRVGDAAGEPARSETGEAMSPVEIERLRAQILAECIAWLAQTLNDRKER